MEEFRDGSFGDIKPFADALESFIVNAEEGKVKALHVGTFTELKDKKERSKLEDRVEEIERQLKELSPIKSDLIELPTSEYVRAILRESTK